MRRDLTGQKFGMLTVIRYHHSDKRRYWLCQCECGNTTILASNQITSGEVKSCGCLKHKIKNDLTGKRFGRLTVLKFVDTDKYGKSRYLCRCDCGNEKIVKREHLINGGTKSCGCLHKESSAYQSSRMDRSKFLKEGTNTAKIKSKKPQKNSASGVRGVSWNSKEKLWIAQMGFKGKKIYLGCSKDFEKACQLRKEGEEKYFKPVIEKYEK